MVLLRNLQKLEWVNGKSPRPLAEILLGTFFDGVAARYSEELAIRNISCGANPYALEAL